MPLHTDFLQTLNLLQTLILFLSFYHSADRSIKTTLERESKTLFPPIPLQGDAFHGAYQLICFKVYFLEW